MLVEYIADYLFYDILHSYNTFGLPIFVHHYGHVGLFLLHLGQKL